MDLPLGGSQGDRVHVNLYVRLHGVELFEVILIIFVFILGLGP